MPASTTDQIPKEAVGEKDGRQMILRDQLPETRRGFLAEPVIAELQAVTKMEDLIRFQVGVRLFPEHQYEISAGREQYTYEKQDGSQGTGWRDVKAVRPSGSGYDYLNRVAGIDYILPEFVFDQQGQRQPNPIHRRDYVLVAMIAIWRNDVGQLVSYREVIEVDFLRLYEEARMNAKWNAEQTWTNKADPTQVVTERPRGSRDKIDEEWTWNKGKETKAVDQIEWLRDKETGAPLLNADGMPTYRLELPNDVEAACAQRLYDLRKFGLRYAYTVAKNRLMMVATGIRSLPIKKKGEVVVSIAGWRDLLRPEQRQAQARQQAEGVWGTPVKDDEIKPLTGDEMESVGEDLVEGEYADVTRTGEDSQLDPEEGLEAADKALDEKLEKKEA